jgi:betaine-aldehyde dehydrogenase
MDKLKVINPSDQTVVREIPVSSAQDIESVLSSARLAFDKGPWPRFSLAERKKFLLKIRQGILDKAGELAELETLNTGKPTKESTFMDIPSSAKTFEHIAQHFERYLEEETIDIEGCCQGQLRREPMGVVALIVPWNYPMLIASWKLASALAAGNTVILKPSSLTPLTALELGKICQEAGLPEGTVSVLVGSGQEIGERLCSDKRVEMISFTGSNEVGRKIMTYASINVKKLIMELGGKSAAIVCKDADLELAVNGSLCSIFLNQGQMCTGMSRILVEDDIYDKFLDDFTAKAKRIKVGPGMDHETQMGPLISEAQRKKVMDFVEKAKKKGAIVACGGKVPSDPRLNKGFFFEPTVLTEVKPTQAVFQQEVFGPVACFSRFSDIDEAVTLANATDFGLACAIWSGSEEKAERIACSVHAGIIWVNTYGMFYDQLPYGGFKQSGFGKELGREGFLEYTRLKNTVKDRTQAAKPLVNYWYGL